MPIVLVLVGVAALWAWNRKKIHGSVFGADGVATIEEARYAAHQLAYQLFNSPNVPWWLIGVGVGQNQDGTYYVQVAVSPNDENMQAVIRPAYGGVPVVVDSSGATPMEMRTS